MAAEQRGAECLAGRWGAGLGLAAGGGASVQQGGWGAGSVVRAVGLPGVRGSAQRVGGRLRGVEGDSDPGCGAKAPPSETAHGPLADAASVVG